jgi:hypothetical protein
LPLFLSRSSACVQCWRCRTLKKPWWVGTS